jgi:hypothetical protein
MDGFNDGGDEPNGRQMLTSCEESTQNQEKTNGRHHNPDTCKNSFVSPNMVLEQGARKQEESEGVNDGGRQ